MQDEGIIPYRALKIVEEKRFRDDDENREGAKTPESPAGSSTALGAV